LAVVDLGVLRLRDLLYLHGHDHVHVLYSSDGPNIPLVLISGHTSHSTLVTKTDEIKI